MTLDADKSTVSLSGSNWFGLFLTVGLGLAGQAMLFHGRVVTLESQQVAAKERMDALETRHDAVRREILDELRALRSEIKTR